MCHVSPALRLKNGESAYLALFEGDRICLQAPLKLTNVTPCMFWNISGPGQLHFLKYLLVAWQPHGYDKSTRAMLAVCPCFQFLLQYQANQLQVLDLN